MNRYSFKLFTVCYIILTSISLHAGVGVIGNGGGKWQQLKTPLNDFPLFTTNKTIPTQWFWVYIRPNLYGETDRTCREFYSLYKEAIRDLEFLRINNENEIADTILGLIEESPAAKEITENAINENFKVLCAENKFEHAHILDTKGTSYIAANDPFNQKIYLDDFAWEKEANLLFLTSNEFTNVKKQKALKKAFTLHEILGMTVPYTEQNGQFTFSSLYLNTISSQETKHL